jgi:integrase
MASGSPYAKTTDFVFPSLKFDGKVPLRASTFVTDHLRLAAKAVEAEIADGQRFGLYNLRHSLSNWLVNKGKWDQKTVQSVLRHSKFRPRWICPRRRTATKHGRREAHF